MSTERLGRCAGCRTLVPIAELSLNDLCPVCDRLTPEEWAYEAAIERAEQARDDR